MRLKIDRLGHKYGKLTVVNYAESKGKYTYWLCLCECGKEKVIRSASLARGITKSCGCLTQFQPLNNVNQIIATTTKVLYKNYNDGDLSFEDFSKLIAMQCFYCNGSVNISTNFINIYKMYKKSGMPISDFAINNGHFRYNGIDRIRNNELHNKNNSVSCCSICNRFKLALSINIFLENIDNLFFEPKIKHSNECNFISTQMNKYKCNKIIELFGLLYPKRDCCGSNIIMNRIYRTKSSAKHRKIPYFLSNQECAELIMCDCAYCGKKSDPINGYVNGIDRINNDIGYEIYNTISCCIFCNSAKMEMPFNQFKDWIFRIKNYLPILQEKIKYDIRFNVNE